MEKCYSDLDQRSHLFKDINSKMSNLISKIKIHLMEKLKNWCVYTCSGVHIYEQEAVGACVCSCVCIYMGAGGSLPVVHVGVYYVHTQEQGAEHVCVCIHVFVCACVYCVYTRAEAVHVCAGHPQELSLRFIHSAFWEGFLTGLLRLPREPRDPGAGPSAAATSLRQYLCSSLWVGAPSFFWVSLFSIKIGSQSVSL